VVAPSALPNYQDQVLRLTAGASLVARGTLVQSQGKGQAFEVQADEIVVLGFVDDPETYPLQPKQHTAEFLREQAHLRPRSNSFGAIARIRHCAAMAIHRFFTDEGFVWVNTPIVTASDAEGAGQMFRVSTLDMAKPPRDGDGKVDFSKDFFGKEAYLTVSGQLNVEAYCLALSKVYTFGPTFRAENSNTTRHLAEFWMIEPEIAFADLNDDANLAERFLKAIFAAVLAERRDDLEFFEQSVGRGIVTQGGLITRLEAFVGSSFERIEYGEAIDILSRSKKKFDFAPEWGKDLQTEHERYLTEEHVGRPVVVMNYPEQIKAFYMRMNDDGKTVAAMDVLAPGIGEIIGGSQREERLDMLDARMRKMNLVPEHYGWYRDLRRYGSVPHAGFGLGFERLIVYICGLGNIRDAIPYPRVPGWAQF
jgi:asparaginyl-tRNA synthetase